MRYGRPMVSPRMPEGLAPNLLETILVHLADVVDAR
jgi:hypothetical protein